MKTQSDPKFIGNRISVVRSKEDIVITITQQIQRWQETLLMTWLAAWTFCGVVFIEYMIQSPHSSDRIFFAICTAVWMYFFYRIAKVFLWRKGGREIIRIHEGKISIINAYWKSGKAEDFNMQNIFKLGKVTSSPTNFLAFLDDSFWIIGGERVGFNYGTSKIRLGKQLASKDAELLVRVIESGMKEFSKKAAK